MDLPELKLSKMKSTLDKIKEDNQRAKAQEELLLKQLEEEFEIDTLEEGYELYEQLIDSKNDRKKKVANQIETLYNNLVTKGLIDATQ